MRYSVVLYLREVLDSAVNFTPDFSASARACLAAAEKRPRRPTVIPLEDRYSRFVVMCLSFLDIGIYYIRYLRICKYPFRLYLVVIGAARWREPLILGHILLH